MVSGSFLSLELVGFGVGNGMISTSEKVGDLSSSDNTDFFTFKYWGIGVGATDT